MLLPSSATHASSLRDAPAHPVDLSGTWYFGTATPFERPTELGTKKTYSDAEVKHLVERLERHDIERLQPSDPNRPAPRQGAAIGQEADANFITTRTNLTRVDGAYRTSLIVDPPDGRLPFRDDARDIFDEWRDQGVGPFSGPEVRPASERCLSVTTLAPTVPWRYNANLRIVQTDDHIVLHGELLAPRIVRLGERQERLGHARWAGDPVASWDGDALVIESTNFRPEISWFRFKVSDEMTLTERFERVSEHEIFYRYTLKDPKIYTRPYTAEMTLVRRGSEHRLYEFACHEGNYSLAGILRGARVQETEQPVISTD